MKSLIKLIFICLLFQFFDYSNAQVPANGFYKNQYFDYLYIKDDTIVLLSINDGGCGYIVFRGLINGNMEMKLLPFKNKYKSYVKEISRNLDSLKTKLTISKIYTGLDQHLADIDYVKSFMYCHFRKDTLHFDSDLFVNSFSCIDRKYIYSVEDKFLDNGGLWAVNFDGNFFSLPYIPTKYHENIEVELHIFPCYNISSVEKLNFYTKKDSIIVSYPFELVGTRYWSKKDKKSICRDVTFGRIIKMSPVDSMRFNTSTFFLKEP